MNKYLLWAVGALIVLTQSAFALPVIPGASGFGIDTPAGRGGQVIKVTNLNSSGAGSLRACVDQIGPRVCVFEVAGNINITGDIKIWNPNITIAGQTAPHPGITILGAGLKIKASDVLVQHIAVRPGDRPDGPGGNVRRALNFGGNSRVGTIENIVIDHCSFSWSMDQIVGANAGYWDKVTIRNSIFAFPLHDSFHPQTAPPGDGNGHGLGMLISAGPGKIDISGSLIAHSKARNPKVASAGLVFRNNVVYNYQRLGTQLVGKGVVSRNDVVANVYIEGADNTGKLPIWLGGDSQNLDPGSLVYLSGNLRVMRDGSTSSNVLRNFGSSSSLSNTPLFASLSSQVAPVNAGAFVRDLLANAGRRPATRDSNDVDSRAEREVINRTGRMINCVEDDGSDRCNANAGGWPADSQARITLNIPANPNGDSDGDGYTNLEEWLHALAAEVEVGGGSSTPPPPAAQPLPPTLTMLSD